MPERIPPAPLRSYLYAPGSRPHVMDKALRAGADAVILDLEDAVAPADKWEARKAVGGLLRRTGTSARCEVHVRVNRAPDQIDLDDVAAVVAPGLSGLRIPKASSGEELATLAARLDELEARAGMPAGAVAVYPIVESAAGVTAAAELAAAPRVVRLAFGATDFLADIAAWGDPDGPGTLLARGTLVLVSRTAGIAAPIDSVHTRIDDPEGLARGLATARALGFFGKSIIHPRQIAAVHDAFTPSRDELDRARRVLERAGGGATTLDGELVDPAVVARARTVLARAGGDGA